MRYLLALAILLSLVVPCEARRRGGYTSSCPVGAWAMPEEIDPKLQAIAQQRADCMARAGILSHDIHVNFACPSWQGLGVAEGIGCSTASDPKQVATCVCGSIVAADAWARAASGTIYRVRFFTN